MRMALYLTTGDLVGEGDGINILSPRDGGGSLEDALTRQGRTEEAEPGG